MATTSNKNSDEGQSRLSVIKLGVIANMRQKVGEVIRNIFKMIRAISSYVGHCPFGQEEFTVTAGGAETEILSVENITGKGIIITNIDWYATDLEQHLATFKIGDVTLMPRGLKAGDNATNVAGIRLDRFVFPSEGYIFLPADKTLTIDIACGAADTITANFTWIQEGLMKSE